jgi:hypothetical protein
MRIGASGVSMTSVWRDDIAGKSAPARADSMSRSSFVRGSANRKSHAIAIVGARGAYL